MIGEFLLTLMVWEVSNLEQHSESAILSTLVHPSMTVMLLIIL